MCGMDKGSTVRAAGRTRQPVGWSADARARRAGCPVPGLPGACSGWVQWKLCAVGQWMGARVSRCVVLYVLGY